MAQLMGITLLFISITANGQTSTDEWQQHSNDKFEIKYPGDWELNESGQMGTTFFIFSAVTSEEDLFKENVNLLVQDLSAYDLTLEQYAEISEEQIK